MKKSPLRKVTRKRAAELAIYYSLKKYILSQRVFCEMPSRTGAPTCMNHATQIHHMKGRGKMLNVVKYWMAICNDCHAWIHENGREARAKGLLQ